MSAYIEQDSQFFTRRGLVVGAILLLHVFIAWALATGLAHKAIEALAPPIQTVIEQETKQEAPPPPPPPPTFERPPVEIPPTDTIVELPVQQAATTAITNTTTQHVAAPPPKAAGVKVSGRPGKGFPNTEDFYPAASKRLNEEGATVVRVCVGPNGKITETPTVQTSSGSARLDEGAINLAKAGSGKYQAATEDGKAITDCFAFRIVFKMQK
jgi:periplasmic protein TonB